MLLSVVLLLLLHFRRLGSLVGICLLERDDWLSDDLSLSVIAACSIMELCEPLEEED